MLKNTAFNEKGIALIAIVGMIAVVSILSTAAVTFAKNQQMNSIRQKKQMQAYYIADAGVVKVKARINEALANSLTPDLSQISTEIGNQAYGGGKIISVVLSKPSDSEYTVESTGIYPNKDEYPNAPDSFFSTRTIEATLVVADGGGDGDGGGGGNPKNGIWTDLLTVAKECKILSTIYCSGPIDGAKEIVVGEPGKVYNIYANGNINVKKEAKIYGSIFSRGDIDLNKDFSMVSESETVQAFGDISIRKHAVTGSIKARGNISIAKDSTMSADVFAGGTVTLGDNSVVDHDVKAHSDLTLGKEGRIKGSAWTMGRLILGKDSKIDGTAWAHLGHPYSSDDVAKVTGGINPLDQMEPVEVNITKIPDAPYPVLTSYETTAIKEGHYYNSDTTIDLGSGTWNGTYYINGDLTLDCTGGKYSGKATIAASGSISTAKEKTVTPKTSEYSLQLIAGNNISFNEENTITAFLWAGNNVSFDKEFVFKGNIICHELDAAKEGTIEEAGDGFNPGGGKKVEVGSWQ